MDNANSVHAFNRFEEKGYIERFKCHFRLANILRHALYALVTPAIQQKKKKIFSEYFVTDDRIQKFFDLKKTINKDV